MLMALLKHGGKCSIERIARSILRHDQSQIECYEETTKQIADEFWSATASSEGKGTTPSSQHSRLSTLKMATPNKYHWIRSP
jgi:hypothetical protein